MTLADLRAEVQRLLPGQSSCVSMELWSYQSGSQSITVQIWDGHRIYEGLTAEGALEALRLHLRKSA